MPETDQEKFERHTKELMDDLKERSMRPDKDKETKDWENKHPKGPF